MPKKSNICICFFRLYLAAMHHNENAKREQAMSKGKLLWKLLYPKSVKGRASARVIKKDATFGKSEF